MSSRVCVLLDSNDARSKDIQALRMHGPKLSRLVFRLDKLLLCKTLSRKRDRVLVRVEVNWSMFLRSFYLQQTAKTLSSQCKRVYQPGKASLPALGRLRAARAAFIRLAAFYRISDKWNKWL